MAEGLKSEGSYLNWLLSYIVSIRVMRFSLLVGALSIAGRRREASGHGRKRGGGFGSVAPKEGKPRREPYAKLREKNAVCIFVKNYIVARRP